MALDQNKRLAALGTVAEAFGLTWEQRLPYVVMALLLALPGALAMAAGLFDSLAEIAAASKAGYTNAHQFPWTIFISFWLLGLVVMVFFQIFWYRFVLLGRAEALRFSFADLNGMVWRSLGYFVVLILVGLVFAALSMVVALLAAMLVSIVTAVLGAEDSTVAGVIVVAVMFCVYLLPMFVLARLALVFPAIAVGERFSLGDSWAVTRGSTLKLVAALLIASLPIGIATQAMNFGIFAALGVNLFDPLATATAAYDYWFVNLAMTLIWPLAMALGLTVIAIAFRDLGDGPATAEEPDLSYAH